MGTSVRSGGVQPELRDGFELAGWLVQPRLYRLRRRGQTLQIEPKMMQVLVCLAEHAGAPVSRERLLAAAWPGAVVTDDVLTRAVSELRKIFDDDPKQGRIIETIPKVGYRLVAPLDLGVRGDSVSPAVDVPAVVPSVSVPPARSAPVPGWAWPLAAVVVGGVFLALYATRPLPPPSGPLQARPLTTMPGREYSASLSPDGNHVAFVRSRDDETGNDVYVSSIEHVQPLRLTDDPDTEWRPVWSPDGSTIAFVRRSAGACGVYAVPALGGPERKLAGCGSGFAELAWSPEPSGRWLALAESVAGEPGPTIHLLDLEQGQRWPLTALDGGQIGDTGPRFSPDGRRLAFVRSYGENMQELCLVELPEARLPEAQPACLGMEQQGISGFDWTPDGEDLVFASNRRGTFSLWKVPATGGEPVWLAVGQESLRPSMARHARRLVYEHWTNDSNIYRVARDAPGESALPIAPSTRMDFFPDFTPDGRSIAFVSDRSGRYEVWRSDADGEHARPLTNEGYPYALAPRWSPDGRRLAYAAYLDGRSALFVIDGVGAQPRLLIEGATHVYPSWSADGRWIYFGSDRGGVWQVWKIPAGGGEAVQVTKQGGYVGRESPDGETFYFTRRAEDGLWQMPAAGGAESLVFGQLRSFDASNWTLAGGGVYFIDRGNTPDVSIAYYDFRAGQISEVVPLGRVMTEGGFSVSPDGSRVLYIQVDQANADLMLVEGI